MSPTFNLGKDAGDIQEPELMPEDWYDFEISKEPEQMPNNVLKAMNKGEEVENPEKAGENIVVNVKVISEIPEFSGRPMRLWLPLPNEADSTNYTPIGQTVEDSKVERIVEFTEAFSGVDVEGDSVSLVPGMKGSLYVIQQLDMSGQNMQNSINTFAGARPVATVS